MKDQNYYFFHYTFFLMKRIKNRFFIFNEREIRNIFSIPNFFFERGRKTLHSFSFYFVYSKAVFSPKHIWASITWRRFLSKHYFYLHCTVQLHLFVKPGLRPLHESGHGCHWCSSAAGLLSSQGQNRFYRLELTSFVLQQLCCSVQTRSFSI